MLSRNEEGIMTTPTVIITIEDGVVQSVDVSHQVRVIVLDRDTRGADWGDLTMVDGMPAFATVWGNPCLPSDVQRKFIWTDVNDVEKDERQG